MKNPLKFRNLQSGSMLWGFLLVILGLFAMMSPAVSGLAVTMMLGVLMLIAGLDMIIFSFGSESFGRGVLRFLFGGITGLAGIAIFSQPGMALATLTMFLMVYFIVDGLFMIIAGLRLEQGKGLVIFNGVATLILGVLIWRGWPVSGLWAVGILLGIRLVIGGMTMMALETARNANRKQLSE